MAQSKTRSTSPFQEKINDHKNFTNKVAKRLSSTFLVNNLLGKGIAAAEEGPEPFEFVITIVIQAGISIQSVNVNGVVAKKEDFKIDGSNLIGTIKAFVSTLTFLLIIDAQGEPNTNTTFNLTCDGTKVFKDDQKIAIGTTGRGGFSNPKVPLP